MTIARFIILMLLCEGQSVICSVPSVLTHLMTYTPIEALITTIAGSMAIVPTVNTEMLETFKHHNLSAFMDRLVPEIYAQINNEDMMSSVGDLIIKNGYPMEKHTVQTEDGYILHMYRIPGNGTPVFLMHGVPGSADDFILNGPENGLAYLLANEGYDVWMGNARGNKHSRHHRRLPPDDPKFWDFTWHEIGYYDLPAMIDHALEESKADKLKYIGHSQGTTVFFVMAAERPEYNDKVSLMVALSPVAYLRNVKSPIINVLAPRGILIYNVIKRIGIHEFLPDNNTLINSLKLLICGVGHFADIFCRIIIYMLVGFDLDQLNMSRLPVIMSHMPSGASVKQIVHYNQCINSGEFRKYDFGVMGNLKRYGQEKPPKYSLDRIKVPISLFYSDGDWLAHPTDVNKLNSELPNVIDLYKIPYKYFSHLDFLFAKDFNIIIYERLQKLLLSYQL